MSLTTASLLLFICLLPGCGVPEGEHNKVKSDLEAAQADNVKLMNDNQILMSENLRLMAKLEQSLASPYTAISGRQITWAWKDMDGNLHKWTLPMDGYRSWIEITKPDETVRIKCGSETYTMVDFRPYVRPDGFSKVIPDFYQQCADEREFAQEAFNLVSQLTVYSEDIGEVARWPVETLTEAGGDCEDLSILFASLLKAAPYPYKLSLVYMDADNPTDPQHPNHVMVRVETDDWKLFVECTNDQGWGYWKQVTGWFFEL
jgi:hypothetical protein